MWMSAILVSPEDAAPVLDENQEYRYCYAIKSRQGTNLDECDLISLEMASQLTDFKRLFLVRNYIGKIGFWGG